MNPTCLTCKFYTKLHVDGMCQRFPPTTVLVGMQNSLKGPQPALTSAFPTIRSDLWCGEHRTKIEAMQ
jgi:hypothetical protein